MAVSYVDRQNGSDTANPLGTEANPRQSWPTQADGLVIRLKRGSRYDMTAQYNFTAQGQIIADYGDPSLPKPILSALHAASSASHVLYGDTIFANIHFDKYDRVGNETQASPIGQNVINHQRRGNAASPAKIVSAAYLNCSFTNCGNNAIACGYVLDSEWADSAPAVLLLGCDFDGIASDCFYGSVNDYFEVAHCTARNFGIRAVSTGDFIGMISCAPKYVWIHDNYVDHTTDDNKHCIIIDVVAGQLGGMAVIERNVLLGYGALNPALQSTNHTVLNLEMPHILRQNYIRGSRILYFSANLYTAESLIHSNIFDFSGDKAVGIAAVSITAPNSEFVNNTLLARRRGAGAVGVAYNASATRSSCNRNVLVGFDQAIACNGLRTSLTGGGNRFAATGSRYSTYSTGAPLADGTNDANFNEAVLLDAFGAPIRPPRNAFVDTMSRLDRRLPDFWGRFAPEGTTYIGALMERGVS